MKKYKYLFPTLTAIIPTVSLAQSDAQSLLVNTLDFINDSVIPFLFGIAFLFFVINVFRYFILDSANEEGREKAKSLIIYGVGAFVFLIIFYGIVNILSLTTGLEGTSMPCPDYVEGPDGCI